MQAMQDDEKLGELIDSLIQFGDENGDKEIDFQEFENLVSSICLMYQRTVPPKNEMESVFKLIDTDNSRKLSKDEIKNMIKNVFSS